MEAQGFVTADGAEARVSPWGEAVRFSNDYAEGKVVFLHRPPEGSTTPLENAEILEISGETAAWEMQIQVRFRALPEGNLWCGIELSDGPMQLGMLSRGFARALLKVASGKAHQRGAELRYALGDEGNGAKPHISVPLFEAFRMFRSKDEVSLPITHKGKKGTWHWSGSDWEEVDRSAKDFLDTVHRYTFIFNTGHIDWHEWKVVGIPALKSLDLGLFWGSQACSAVIYDDAGPDGASRHFFDVTLLPPEARTSADADLCGAAEDKKLADNSTYGTLPTYAASGNNTPGTTVFDDDDQGSFDGGNEEGSGSGSASWREPSIEEAAAPAASHCSLGIFWW